MRHLAVLLVALCATATAAREARPAAAIAAGGVEDQLTNPSGARRARRISGAVEHVRDGDTIVVAGWALRLWGLHAPELRAPGGQAARRRMQALTVGQIVACDIVGGRSHGRLVAVCRTDAGDLAAQLIDSGLGRDCPRFSRGLYAGRETDAGRVLTLPAYCRTR